MKKLLWFFVIAIFILSGCGSNADDKEAQTETKKEVETTEQAETETDDAVETDEEVEAGPNININANDAEVVKIIMPAEFFEFQSEEEVIAYFKDEGVDDVTVNADGSYTLNIPKAEHEAMLNDMRAEIDADIDAILASMNLAFIKEASMNDIGTELTVAIDQSIYEGDMGGLVLMDFSLHAMPLQLLQGVTEEDFDFEVVLVDSETGEEFERTSIHDTQ